MVSRKDIAMIAAREAVAKDLPNHGFGALVAKAIRAGGCDNAPHVQLCALAARIALGLMEDE